MIKDRNKMAVFILCLIGYSGAYLCRLNFSAAMPEMVANKIFTSSELGMITSIFFLTYGLGQLLNGYLGDKIPPRYMFFFGLIFSGMANFLIMFFQGFTAMALLWGLNGFAQSMLWPPIIHIMGNYYNKSEKTKFAKYFSISVPLGTLASYGLSMLWIALFGWKFVFILNGLIIIPIAVIWLIFSNNNLKIIKQKQLEQIDSEQQKTSNISRLKKSGFAKTFAISGLLFMLIPVAIHGALKDSATTWVPVFLVENFSTPTSISLLLTMILPIVNLTGGFFAIMLNNKIKNEIATSTVFFAIAALSVVTLLFFGKFSIVLSVGCLAVLTNCMVAINVLTISLIPLHFAKYNKVSAVSGIFNSTAYLGCAIVNAAVGFLAHEYSWSGVIILWVALAVFACLICLATGFIWKKFFIKDQKLYD